VKTGITPEGPPLIWIRPSSRWPVLPGKVSAPGYQGTLRSTTNVIRSSAQARPLQSRTGAV
jgi:hypothetical protein